MAGLGTLIIFLLWAPLSLSQDIVGGLDPLSLSQDIVGGWAPADTNSKAVQDIAEFCVSQYNTNSDGNLFKIKSLEDASQQVVAGMNYKLTIVLVQTECKKNSENSPSCDKSSSSKCRTEKCVCSVYDVPWENERTLSSLTCTGL